LPFPVSSASTLSSSSTSPFRLNISGLTNQSTYPGGHSAYVTSIPSRGPADVAQIKEKGNELFKKGLYKEAVSKYTECIEIDGQAPVYWINRAMALIKLERYDEAIRDCSRGLELDPANIKALWRRGVARIRIGQWDQGIR
ncbi:hypothetical protein EV182_005313, partial [Spiromyces aspiralis]